MKYLPSLFLFLLSFNGFGNEAPEMIELKTKVIRTTDWYAHQAELWKENVASAPTSIAWINYYLAARYAAASHDDLVKIAKDVTVSAPGSFEDHFINGLQLGYAEDAFLHLHKAYQINPDAAVLYSSLQLVNEFRGDLQNRKVFSELLMKANQVSTSLLSYSYNLLMSLEENAVLLTEGENTTVPIFILQDVMKVRNDVQVLNLDMMFEPFYRDRLKTMDIKLGDLSNFESEAETKKTICAKLPGENPHRKFYYSLTISKQHITDIKDQLYVVGLASQMSKERVDNIAALKENLENRFLLDHLTVDFQGEGAYASGKVLSVNYLVPILLLTEYYTVAGNSEKLKRWQFLINKLADEHGKSGLVENYLKRRTNYKSAFKPADINPKSLEGSAKHVKDNIYAMDAEVTNADYKKFLKYLKETNQTEAFDAANIDLSKYDEPALSFMKGYHMDREVTKKEKFFENYPIVNISYEAAVAYCEWLTEQYNNSSERKYKQVKFRLPSVNEWQVAALGYKKIQSWVLDENMIELRIQKVPTDMLCKKGCDTKTVAFKESDIKYPWYGAYYFRNKPLNSKDCALGNFKWPEGTKSCHLQNGGPVPDGFVLMSPVKAYFPNDIGLYDVVGNVAEMTSQKGKACGGSWNHFPEESTITSVNEYQSPDAAVGFRPFMEVIIQ